MNCSHLAAQTTHSVSCCREFLDGWLLRTLRDPNCYTLLDFKAIRLATQWFGPCRSMLMVRHIKSKWKSVAKLLSMSFPVRSSFHCWATSSNSLMHELKAVKRKQFYLICNWLSNVNFYSWYVSCWESLSLCNLLIFSSQLLFVAVCVCHWVWLIACALTFCVTQSVCDSCLLLCVCHLV